MAELFPPPLGAQIAGRFELLAPLRGDGAVLTFLAHDLQTGQRRALTLFDPAYTQADVWAEYARLVAAAAEAKVPGVALPSHVPASPPDPPHVVDDPSANRGLDRLRVQEGPIPWQRALAIGERLAGVLHEIHTVTGAAHRALTPSRCTVNVTDEVEVLDYGVAEVELVGDQAEEAEYRAPEQRAGKGDARSDVFSLAAILYELISGTSPSDTPRPSLSSLSVPPAVARLLDQSLAIDPAQRPADPATMRASLREILGLAQASPSWQEAPTSPPPTTPGGALNKPLSDAPSLRQLDPLPTIPTTKQAAALLAQEELPRGRSLQHHPFDEPPTERTERLPPRPSHQDSTLVLSNSDESPTERLRPISLVRPRGADDLNERTEVYNRRPDHGVAPEERTEKVRSNDLLVERTEVLGTLPARGHSPQLERTEVLDPLPARHGPLHPDRPALQAGPRLSDVPRRLPGSIVSDEDRTLVMSRNDRGLVQSWSTSPPPLAQTKGALDGAELERPRRDQELRAEQPSPLALGSSPHRMLTLERSQRTALLAVNLVLALTLLIGLLTWVLS